MWLDSAVGISILTGSVPRLDFLFVWRTLQKMLNRASNPTRKVHQIFRIRSQLTNHFAPCIRKMLSGRDPASALLRALARALPAFESYRRSQIYKKSPSRGFFAGSGGRIRTYDQSVTSESFITEGMDYIITVTARLCTVYGGRRFVTPSKCYYSL
jgi:hypothetical protein